MIWIIYCYSLNSLQVVKYPTFLFFRVPSGRWVCWDRRLILIGDPNQLPATVFSELLGHRNSVETAMKRQDYHPCTKPGGGPNDFLMFFIFTPTREDDPIWRAYVFQMGWFNHQVVYCLKQIGLTLAHLPFWGVVFEVGSFGSDFFHLDLSKGSDVNLFHVSKGSDVYFVGWRKRSKRVSLRTFW